MKGIGLFTIFSLWLVASGCDSGITSGEQPQWMELMLNDSLSLSMPEAYSEGPGFWIGRDTWGFYKARDDMHVVFRFETGPGTPYSPGMVQTLPDTHIVYPYGRQSPESYITDRYADRIVIDIADQKHLALFCRSSDTPRFRDGVVLVESLHATAFTEILFVSYDVAKEPEVLRILRTLYYRNLTFISKARGCDMNVALPGECCVSQRG